MKEIDLSKLTADPLSKARCEADGETITISGYIRSVHKDTISLTDTQTSSSYTEYPRSSVIAAFEDDKKPGKITLLVLSDTEVKIVTTRRMNTFKNSKKCRCSDIGVAEARPLDSIHPALAELAREIARIKAETSKGSCELGCGEGRADCFRNGGTKEECNLNDMMCHMNCFFNY